MAYGYRIRLLRLYKIFMALAFYSIGGLNFTVSLIACPVTSLWVLIFSFDYILEEEKKF